MINLLLAIHNHQPVGNFEHVFKMGFEKCYWPIIDTLKNFPKIKISLHHSGPLLDWAKNNDPSYLKELVRLIHAGQVEPLGGGYYEPILASIPPRDAKGQLAMMRQFWNDEAGFDCQGIWMTERIWEPSMATVLAENGVKYTILDDEHFRAAGKTDEFILNYYLTERHGKTTAVFASDKTLRYFIPFKMPEDVIGHLNYLADKYPNSAVTYGDDGEKFGMWPGTFEWVIEKGWLKKFLTLLSENSAKIRTSTLSEFYDANSPSGTVYLPTCSYHEMGEWAMPPKAIQQFETLKEFLTNSGRWEHAKQFVRGGYWDNFLTKYPESNYMHKRMIYVSERLDKQSKDNPEARQALYRAQCNCPYWHGLFGGLYLNYLRHAIYSNLIEADRMLDAADKKKERLEVVDIDRDLSNEVVLSNSNLFAVLKPNRGGSMIEFSHKRAGLNLQDVLARREEAYHSKKAATAKQGDNSSDGIPSIHDIGKTIDCGKVVYDPCPRYSFLDHIWKTGSTPEHEETDKSANIINLCHLNFEMASTRGMQTTLIARGPGNFEIAKTYTLEKQALNVRYELLWQKPLEKEIRFGTELNLTLLAGHDDGRYYLDGKNERQLMDYAGTISGVRELSLIDEYFKFALKISTDKDMDVWRYPVNTISQSESGFDLLYQGSCIIWSALVPKGAQELAFQIRLEFTDR